MAPSAIILQSSFFGKFEVRQTLTPWALVSESVPGSIYPSEIPRGTFLCGSSSGSRQDVCLFLPLPRDQVLTTRQIPQNWLFPSFHNLMYTLT